MENSVFNDVDDAGNPLEDGVDYALYDPEMGIEFMGSIVRYDVVEDQFFDMDGFQFDIEVDMYGGSLCFARRQT